MRKHTAAFQLPAATAPIARIITDTARASSVRTSDTLAIALASRLVPSGSQCFHGSASTSILRYQARGGLLLAVTRNFLDQTLKCPRTHVAFRGEDVFLGSNGTAASIPGANSAIETIQWRPERACWVSRPQAQGPTSGNVEKFDAAKLM